MTLAPNELTVDAAIAHLAPLVAPVTAVEQVALDAAAGRVLAADIASSIDLPAFDNSAMDGYAVRHADLAGGALREIGHSYAGHGFHGTLGSGDCVRIMTGAPIPAGADTVVVLEDVDRSEGHVRIDAVPPPGANIRRRGEHITRGAIALAAGHWLDDAAVGLAASVGCATLPVRRRLRVALLSTGDELADPPAALAAAGSYDANRPFLRVACARLGLEVIDLGICTDRAEAFARRIDTAFDAGCDVLMISGGAAQGDVDIVRQAGGVNFTALNIRPGRGIAHAQLRRGEQPLALLGLPGNAVAAFVMFHRVARPLLLRWAGADMPPLPRLTAPLAHEVRLRGGRIDYRRARFDAHGAVTLLPDQGSAMLRTVVDADCLVALGPASHHAAGTAVEVIPLALLR